MKCFRPAGLDLLKCSKKRLPDLSYEGLCEVIGCFEVEVEPLTRFCPGILIRNGKIECFRFDVK